MILVPFGDWAEDRGQLGEEAHDRPPDPVPFWLPQPAPEVPPPDDGLII